MQYFLFFKYIFLSADGVFRQRLNTEIENFRVNINEIVDDQEMNLRSMFTLQPDIDPAQQVMKLVKLCNGLF